MPNRFLEEPPSFACLTRKLHSSYEPLASSEFQMVQNQQMTLRPPPYVAYDALTDFYLLMQGQCGIGPFDPNTFKEKAAPSGAQSAASEALRAPLLGAAPQPSPSAPGGLFPTPPPNASVSPVEYRQQQMMQNQQSQARGGRTCSYFNSREGCRRGLQCPYLHVVAAGGARGPASSDSEDLLTLLQRQQ